MSKWALMNDSNGDQLLEGTEDEVKTRYREVADAGAIQEMDLYFEDPDGEQFAWNPNVDPPRWDEL